MSSTTGGPTVTVSRDRRVDKAHLRERKGGSVACSLAAHPDDSMELHGPVNSPFYKDRK